MAMQDIDPRNSAPDGPHATEPAHAPETPRFPAQADTTAYDQTDPKSFAKLGGELTDGRVSLAVRTLLLALLPATVCGLCLDQFARHGATWSESALAGLALASLGAAYAIWQARRLVGPMKKIIARADLLAARYCGQVPVRSRCEVSTLVHSFDAMTAALLSHAQTSRQLYAAEAQNALDLQRQYALMQMLRNLASAANDGEPLDAALKNSLREIGTYLDWPIGRLVLVTRKKAGEIESVQSYWYAPDPKRFSAFIDACSASCAQAESTGLIGHAQESHLSHWVSDLGRMQDWSRRVEALACGLRTGFIIPISAGPDMTAYVEFFADHRIEASAEMLELVEAISVELWNTANRYQSDVSLHAPAARVRRQALIAENLDDAIALTTPDGRIEWANAQLTGLAGVRATEPIGRNLAELLFAANSTSAAECRRQIASGVRAAGLVLATRSDIADVPWLELQIRPLPEDGTGPGAVLVVVRDATRQRAEQAALNDALACARRESESRPAFLADLSQGLRAPVKQMLGVADQLLATQLNERQRNLSEALCRSAETLLGVTNDMRDLARIESGQLALQLQDLDLCALVENLVDRMAPRAHAKGIELAYRLSPELPAAVRGDPARLRQILLKLVDNAIKYTERGEVVLIVGRTDTEATLRPEAAATPIRFLVRDTGAGMRPETLERLFATGSPPALASAHRPGATGLGLALCRRLAELMNGTLSVRSRIGEGSEFRLEVPLLPVACPAAAPAIEGAAALAGRRVLIAEDNPTNRRILSEQLSALAMDCAIAENGRQALQMLRIAANSASPFDVAIIDMKMPFMDGVELAERIRSDPTLRALRVIMLTSTANGQDLGPARTGGVDAYLAKPVRRQDLIEILASAIATQPPLAVDAAPGSTASAFAPAPAVLPMVVAASPAPADARSAHAAAPARKVLEKRVLDEIVAMERNGAKDLLQRLVATYEISSRSLVRAADVGLEGRDAAGAVQALHTLKLSSANLGALRFSRSCGEIEALAREEQLGDAQRRWPAVRAEHENVLLALRALLPVSDHAAPASLQEFDR